MLQYSIGGSNQHNRPAAGYVVVTAGIRFIQLRSERAVQSWTLGKFSQ